MTELHNCESSSAFGSCKHGIQNHATNSKVDVTDKKVKDTENEPNLHPKKKLPVICIEFQDVNSSRNLINLNKPRNHDSTTNY
jgi:hypothetical protein